MGPEPPDPPAGFEAATAHKRFETALSPLLREAAAAHPGRDVLVLSDGRAPGGDPLAAAGRVRALGGRVHALIPPKPAADAGLLHAVARGGPGAFRLEGAVGASTPGAGSVQVAARGELLGAWRTELTPGVQHSFVLALPEGFSGGAALRVRWIPDPGTPNDDRANDQLTVSVPAPQPRVLVWGELAEQEIAPLWPGRVQTRFDLAPEDLAAADVVVLSNQPLSRIAPVYGALRAFVQRGGQLIVHGGPDAWRAGSWGGSAFEAELLPLEVPRPEGEARAIALLLDRSGSTARGTLTVLTEAARALASALAPGEALAVLPFAARGSAVLLPPGWAPAGDAQARSRLSDAMASLSAQGDTDFVDAIHRGIDAVRKRDAQERVVVLISDGDPHHTPEPAALTTLRQRLLQADVRLYALVARMEQSVAAMRTLTRKPEDVMPLASVQALRSALEGLSRTWRERDELLLGPISLSANRAARDEDAHLVQVGAPLPMLHDVAWAQGAVRAIADGRGPDGALHPVAAVRRVGAGKVYAMAFGPEHLPVGAARSAWTRRLARWWQDVAARTEPAKAVHLREGRLRVDWPSAAGAGRVRVESVEASDGEPLGQLLETVPGVFVSAPRDWPAAPLRARDPAGTHGPIGLLLPSRPDAEHRGSGVDRAALEALAQAGGGRVLQNLGELPAPRGGGGAPLAPWLCLLALGLFVLERWMSRAEHQS